MPEACSFRQVDEKHTSTQVERMLWSPRMDLIAVANIQGEVRPQGLYSETLCVHVIIFGRTDFTVNIVLSGIMCTIMRTTLPTNLPTIQ